MLASYVCNRCHKEMHGCDELPQGWMPFSFGVGSAVIPWSDEYHLCNECRTAHIEFMKNEPDQALVDLTERLERAVVTLEADAAADRPDADGFKTEKFRLLAKIEGVKLALDYLRSYGR